MSTAPAPSTRPDSTSPAPARDWRAYDARLLPPIVDAARACFVESGYDGTSIREIAERAGLSVPGLYHHYRSKQALLVAILEVAMADLWWRSEAALVEAGEDPVARIDALVECLVLFHAHERDLAFLAWSELRSTEPQMRAEHVARRDRQQRLLEEAVEDGVRAGVVGTPYPRETSRAVVTMCTAVAQWYRTGGELSPADLAARYQRIARDAFVIERA